MPITLLKDGRYRLRIYADGKKTGRRIQETLPYGTTKQEAETYYRRKVAEAFSRRGLLAPAFWSIAGLVEDYVQTQAHRLAPGTRAAYLSSAKTIKAAFGKTRLDRITPAEVQRFQQARAAAGLSPHTINREIVFIKTVLQHAVAQGWLTQHPLPKGSIRRLRVTKNRTRFFSREEWDAFMKHREGEDAFEMLSYKTRRRIIHLRPFWQVLLLTGLRIGEAVSLTWEDVDLGSGRISILQEKTRTVKHVPISSALRAVLESLPRGTPAARLFTDFDGSELQDFEARNAFAAARDLAGLPRELLVHSVRHTFASWLASAGVPLHTIGQLLGHTSPDMTARYAHLSDAALVDAVEVMSRLFSGAQSPSIRHQGATISAFPLKREDL